MCIYLDGWTIGWRAPLLASHYPWLSPILTPLSSSQTFVFTDSRDEGLQERLGNCLAWGVAVPWPGGPQKTGLLTLGRWGFS